MTTTSLTFCRSLLLAVFVALCWQFLCANAEDVIVVQGAAGAQPATSPATGDTPMVMPAGALPPGVDPAMLERLQKAAKARGKLAGPPGTPPGTPPSTPPGKPGEPGKPDEPSKPIQRPTKPESPPDPKELKVRLGKDGRIKLNFTGQPWLGVLQWLADLSNMSLDWQEVPGDYLNVRTQRSYTIREVRDLINRRLLDRGYTLLCDGEVMTIVNIKKIDAAIVPRVEPDELEKRDPYEFVKVSFPLDCLTAETAARELEQMKSGNGKLRPMIDANRVEAMDTVVNLREMYLALKHEQSAENQHRPVRTFKLLYARAEDVREELQTLVGGESKPGGHQPQSPEEAQRAMIMRAMQQQQQQQQGGQPGQPGQPPGAAAAAKIPTAFVVNPRENSIVVTAPPDKMAIIAQVIKAVDVPANSDSPDGLCQTQIYRLAGVEPEPIIKTLEEIGHLSPTAHLTADKKNKLIIADASPADQAAIRALVDKLCGSDRQFDVIHLRRLRADSVAASIEFMMGIDNKKKKTESHHWGWSPWDDDYSSNSNDKSNDFRVDADVEHNKLMLWANKIEIGQVKDLLVKLGEAPPQESSNRIKRLTIDGGNPQETANLLKRIQAEWSLVAPNPLSAPVPAPDKGKAENPPAASTPEAELPAPPTKTTAAPPTGTIVRLTDLRRNATPEQDTDMPDRIAGGLPAPVDVRVGPDGKLVVSSKDAQALDLFEELAAELATPRREYTPFQLHHASAFNVRMNLEDFFKEEPRKNKVNLPYYIRDEYGISDDDLQGSGDEGHGLSKRRKLKFLDDSDTNIILVSGATAAQLKTIDELIKLYDQKPPPDSELSRQTEIFYLRHSKAKAVHDTLKDVFRDLLSENDKALANNRHRGERRRFSMFGFDEPGDEGDSGQKSPKFKGSLSIGIDEASNALVVSAPAYVFRDVSKMIKDLDKVAEANDTVRVLRVGHDVTPERLREIINAIQGQGSAGGSAPVATPPRQPGPRRGQRPPGNGAAAAAPHASGE